MMCCCLRRLSVYLLLGFTLILKLWGVYTLFVRVHMFPYLHPSFSFSLESPHLFGFRKHFLFSFLITKITKMQPCLHFISFFSKLCLGNNDNLFSLFFILNFEDMKRENEVSRKLNQNQTYSKMSIWT